MNTWTELRTWCDEQIQAYPEHGEEINDLYQLAMDEAEDESASEQHEIASCISSVEELLEE